MPLSALLAAGALVLAKSVLGGLHHEYSIVRERVSGSLRVRGHKGARSFAEHRALRQIRAGM